MLRLICFLAIAYHFLLLARADRALDEWRLQESAPLSPTAKPRGGWWRSAFWSARPSPALPSSRFRRWEPRASIESFRVHAVGFGTMVISVTAFVLLPVYYRMNLVSIYGYLENRFGVTAQKTGAVFFMIARLVGSSMRLYLLAVALQKFVLDAFRVPFWLTATAIPFLIWSYTFRAAVVRRRFSSPTPSKLFCSWSPSGLHRVTCPLNWTSFAGLVASDRPQPLLAYLLLQRGLERSAGIISSSNSSFKAL